MFIGPFASSLFSRAGTSSAFTSKVVSEVKNFRTASNLLAF